MRKSESRHGQQWQPHQASWLVLEFPGPHRSAWLPASKRPISPHDGITKRASLILRVRSPITRTGRVASRQLLGMLRFLLLCAFA